MRKILFIIPFFLWTCGGGGGSSPTEPEPPQLPTVQNINLEATEDTPKTFTFVGTEPNNLSLTYSISTQPQNGSISISGGSGTYTPNANYNGQDTFLYIASSSSGNSNIGTVLVNIAAVDDEPNSMDVSTTTDEDNSVTMTLEAEEFDGDNIEFNIVGNPSNGSVSISGSSATYIPNQDWFGTDTFNFEAVDSSTRSIINVATATITVNPVNDPPTINGDTLYVFQHGNNGFQTEISLEEASDIENDSISFEINDQPSHGTISIDGNTLTYTSTGFNPGSNLDTFTYRAYDGTDYSSESRTVQINKFQRIGGNGNDYLFGQLILNDYAYLGTSGKPSSSNSYSATIHRLSNTLSTTGWTHNASPHSGNNIIRSINSDANGDIYFYIENYAGSNPPILRIINDGGVVANNTLSTATQNLSITSDGDIIDIKRTDNNIILTLYDINENIIWEKVVRDLSTDSQYNMASFTNLKQTSDGGFLISLYEFIGNVSVYASVVIKTDSQGEVQWTYEWDEAGDQIIHSFKETSNGDFLLAGHNDYLHHIIKIDSSGNELWSDTFGWSTHSYGNETMDVCETFDGGVISTGFSKLPSEDGSVYRLIVNKHDASGNFLWYKIYLQAGSLVDGVSPYNSKGMFIDQLDSKIIISGEAVMQGNSDIISIMIDSDGNRIF